MSITSKISLIGLLLLLSTLILKSQALDEKSHQLIFDAKFFQIKDQHNYGLVFGGPGLDAGYRFYHKKNYQVLEYQGSFGAGGAWSRGMASIIVFFTPMHLLYGFQLNKESQSPVYLGPYIAATYQYHFYPETHGGITSWFTLYDIGVQLRAEISLKKNKLIIDFFNSLVGMASRPQVDRDPYKYSLKFSDFVSNSVSNLKAGSFNLLNQTQLSLDYQFGNRRFYSVGYNFTYLAYFEEPTFDYMSHGFVFKMNLKRNNL